MTRLALLALSAAAIAAAQTPCDQLKSLKIADTLITQADNIAAGDFRPNGAGTYDMAVSGMGPKQRKDAVNVATSSLSYYACPDGHRGRLLGEAAYTDAKWRMQAKCG